jgi:hypothetical protein
MVIEIYMYKSVIFVDFENIQNIETNLIHKKNKIIVMVGLDQDKKAFEFAKNLFDKVSSLELIKVNGRGPNALDLFIAYYIGRYFDTIKESEIIIVSNDTDYDQLIDHIDGYGISIRKVSLTKDTRKKIETAETNGKKNEMTEPSEKNAEITEICENQNTAAEVGAKTAETATAEIGAESVEADEKIVAAAENSEIKSKKEKEQEVKVEKAVDDIKKIENADNNAKKGKAGKNNGKKVEKAEIIGKISIKETKIKINNEIVKKILEYFKNQSESQRKNRPRKISTLENYLFHCFSKEITIEKIKEAVEFMIKNKIVCIINNKVSYNSI